MAKHNASEEHPELKHPSTKRAKQIDADTPFNSLTHALESQDEVGEVKNVVHWFRSKDLRIQDNRGLHNASLLAKEKSSASTSFVQRSSNGTGRVQPEAT